MNHVSSRDPIHVVHSCSSPNVDMLPQPTSMRLLLASVVLFVVSNDRASGLSSGVISRRYAFLSVLSSATLPLYPARPSHAEDETRFNVNYETRDRKGNKGAIIREDYWYMLGRTPPRKLDRPLKGDDPQWNAFGTCSSSESGGNSCTYISLGQRSQAYGKYSFAIAEGAKEYERLGKVLRAIMTSSSSEHAWLEAFPYLTTQPGTLPPPIIDAELKMVLLATALTSSPNFPGPSRELLVARYYANEARFAAIEMQAAIETQDSTRVLLAWEYGKDSWNSYFQVVSRSIVPKVGEPFQAIV
jgi:hypothetical protein